ncbi:hypothetical protein SASPL_118034 [Salvia splendens]|uniref:P-type H(+)-exporting transporter n=1 Tax=Salvia splendens TaxID=180675 RepID=A0A8X8ZYS0_SALSN|nr:hypothetical protein SASPL_118034 [Salvia splendens]
MAIGSHRLSQQGAITKRMTAIEEMARMDVLCCDKTGTLTLNRLTVFSEDADKDHVILQGARASRVENQDAIDACIVGMLADPKEARARITEVHFLAFNPVEKRTTITYIDNKGDWPRVSKGAPKQIIELCNLKEDVKKKALSIIDKFADRGLRSLAVSEQTVPEKMKEDAGSPWVFTVGYYERDWLEAWDGNEHVSFSCLGQHKDEVIANLPVEELIKRVDGFAGVFPEHKYEIVKKLQEWKHICGMTGDGVNDGSALKKADIGIAVAGATDAARGASDIMLTEPGLSVIMSAVLTSRAIFQRTKNYTIYAVSITIRIVLGFMLLALIWNSGIVFGTYLVVMTVVFFLIVQESTFFTDEFGVRSIKDHYHELNSAIYLQVSILSWIEGIGWGCAKVIWLYSLIIYVPLDIFKFIFRYALATKAGKNMTDNRTASTSKKDYMRGEREAQWVMAQLTLHGLKAPESFKDDNNNYTDTAYQAKK